MPLFPHSLQQLNIDRCIINNAMIKIIKLYHFCYFEMRYIILDIKKPYNLGVLRFLSGEGGAGLRHPEKLWQPVSRPKISPDH